MTYKNQFNQYQLNAVNTATPQELTLMLYNGAIKFCNKAIVAIDKKEIQLAHENILRVEDIINEFVITLNHKFPIAERFAIMYDYIHRRLIEANASKDKEILEEVLGYLRELRDTWKEAMKLAKQQNK